MPLETRPIIQDAGLSQVWTGLGTVLCRVLARDREAWPWDTAPRFLIRDRDKVYGSELRRAAQAMGMEDVLTAPRTPWQNPFVERVIGSLRRECLDHVIVWNERSLRRHL